MKARRFFSGLLRAAGGRARKAAESLDRRQRRRAFLFQDLGKERNRRPLGRCLVAYDPYFIGHISRTPEVRARGWDPEMLPAVLEREARGFAGHTMYWESAEIVRQLISRGLLVDYVYSRQGDLIEDPSRYDLIIDEWANLERWSAAAPRSRKVFYSTGAHWSFHNRAELTRLRWLLERRGADLPACRQVPPILGPGVAELISSFGNGAIAATYGLHRPKIRKLRISAAQVRPEPPRRDWSRARHRFLYFNGFGWVHKGLDLAVEAFLREPGLELVGYGFGCRPRDADFLGIYGSEIERAGNIRLQGILDPTSPEFLEAASSCTAFVNVSAAEGCSGAAVQCLHLGLIPVVTATTGIELPADWPAVSDESAEAAIESIRERCREVSEMSERELEERSRSSWEFARSNHTREAYSRSLARFLDELLGERAAQGSAQLPAEMPKEERELQP